MFSLCDGRERQCPARPSTADAVVVGGGTVGGWCAYFLRRSGAERVVVLERSTLGRGASEPGRRHRPLPGRDPDDGSSRDVEPGLLSPPTRGARDRLGVRAQGYFLPAFDDAQVATARARIEMQRACGLDVDWLDPDEAARQVPTLALGTHLGGTFAPGDGYIDPPRNVLAYAVALATHGVEVRERTSFTGLSTVRGPGHRRRHERRPDRHRHRRPHRRSRAGRGWPVGRDYGCPPVVCATRWR